jgi:hypothetical protein
LAGLDWSPIGLWLAVVASGIYHGLNPGMGWPLAVSAGLMERSASSLAGALAYLAAGHLLAMLAMLLPFAFLVALLAWQHQIQVFASLVVMGFGVFLLLSRRHPRVLARIKPTQLALWSFLVAIAHGAGLMLVPIYLGLCGLSEVDAGHIAANSLMATGFGTALLVSLAHTAAMIAASGATAWAVYRYLGLKFLSRSWLNLDALWAWTLVLVGAVSLILNAATVH